MIKSRIVAIEGLDYEIEDNEGRWSVHMPEVLNLPRLDLHPYMLKNGKELQLASDFTYDDALKILHSVLVQLPQVRPVGLHELTDKERVTLNRCCALVSRVAEVPEVQVALFLSPDLLYAYCYGCRDRHCECRGAACIAIARKALQNFETTLKALVNGAAMHKQPFDDESDEHNEEVRVIFARLVLQLAQSES